MDEFGFDRPQLNGALVTLEFGNGGRIEQIWAGDPNLPEEGEEFQFVLAPMALGDELSEDYLPGTFLIGARTGPDEPWAVARNVGAEVLNEGENGSVEFDYELPLLPEVRATGKFYEVSGIVPVVVWDLKIVNRGRKTIEIGELAFPLALSNLYEGFGKGENGKSAWHDRVVVHKFIGGSASHIFAQRLTAEPPGLIVYPGDDTEWEFLSHVRPTLNSPFRWEGIPVVYVYSKAAVEREGWPEWANGHRSLILEPGDSQTIQTRFAPAIRDRFDQVSSTLAGLGHPAIRLLPAAVSPASVGAAVEVAGCTPTRFFTDKECHLEPDSDESGGFCFVRPREPGPVVLSFEDTKSRMSHAHLYFIEPIDQLIRARADWIVKNQVHYEEGSNFDRAIVAANSKTGERIIGTEESLGTFTVEGGLSDALFLAEKNTVFPDQDQIDLLEEYVDEFLRDDLQNPGDDTVGSGFSSHKGVAINYARPHLYPLVFNFYHSMYRLARLWDETAREPQEYLGFAYRTALAMLRHGIPRQERRGGYPGFGRVFEILGDLTVEGMHAEFERLFPFVSQRAEDLLKRELTIMSDEVDTASFEELFTAARYMNDEMRQEQAMRWAYALRSLAPSWWWYGSDSRTWDELQHGEPPIPWDRGELCLGYTGPENSMMFFETLDRDYAILPEAHLRAAFGGMLGVWALVKPDGSASMAYCPDPASRFYGFVPVTGDIGMALYHYLRSAGSYVLPSQSHGVFTFGCHFEVSDSHYTVKPWDGIGKKVVLRQVGAEFTVSIGMIRELALDIRKRWAELTITNPTDRDLRCDLRVRGLWGNEFKVGATKVMAGDGELAVSVPLLPGQDTVVKIEVLGAGSAD